MLTYLPYSYPFHNLLGPIISSIFAGNAIVVKNSEQTAWSSAYYINIVREALQACGFDANLVHAISCWPQTADYFTSHPGVSHLTFIGSKPVAHEVAKSASKALTPLCVELGGKDAAVVLDEPSGRAMSKGELGRVASIIMRGVFQSAGQNCVGIERVIALPSAYDALIKMLEPRIKSLRLGNDLDPELVVQDGVDVGAMISPASFDRLERLIAEARAQGARLLAGGHRFSHSKYPHGHYFAPTLIVDVTPEMRIAREELFAPVCVMMRADTVEEAVRITNSTDFGLGCSVFGPTSSSKARRNLEYVTSAAKAGMVAVNDFAVRPEIAQRLETLSADNLSLAGVLRGPAPVRRSRRIRLREIRGQRRLARHMQCQIGLLGQVAGVDQYSYPGASGLPDALDIPRCCTCPHRSRGI